GGEQALHHELFGAVGRHGEEGAAQGSGPEGVGGDEVDGEVEGVELARGIGDGMDVGPAAGDVRAQGEDGDQAPGDVDDHLHDVGPDNGGHAALKRIEQRKDGDNGDGE